MGYYVRIFAKQAVTHFFIYPENKIKQLDFYFTYYLNTFKQIMVSF